jgi:uncharacterized membrane protein
MTKAQHTPVPLTFECNTPQLLREVFTNVSASGKAALHIPVKVFGDLLADVAHRASQLRDPILDELMCKLALYEEADPYSPSYDRSMVEDVKRRAAIAKATGKEAA